MGHTTAPSDKPWKAQNARRTRRAVHQILDQTRDGDALSPSPYAKGHGDGHGIKDGKQRIVDPRPEDMRK